MKTQMPTIKTHGDRVATALDLTLKHDGRGPRTWMARHRLLTWLDLGRWYQGFWQDVKWLEGITEDDAP